jgi:hypothetical protein
MRVGGDRTERWGKTTNLIVVPLRCSGIGIWLASLLHLSSIPLGASNGYSTQKLGGIVHPCFPFHRNRTRPSVSSPQQLSIPPSQRRCPKETDGDIVHVPIDPRALDHLGQHRAQIEQPRLYRSAGDEPDALVHLLAVVEGLVFRGETGLGTKVGVVLIRRGVEES